MVKRVRRFWSVTDTFCEPNYAKFYSAVPVWRVKINHEKPSTAFVARTTIKNTTTWESIVWCPFSHRTFATSTCPLNSALSKDDTAWSRLSYTHLAGAYRVNRHGWMPRRVHVKLVTLTSAGTCSASHLMKTHWKYGGRRWSLRIAKLFIPQKLW